MRTGGWPGRRGAADSVHAVRRFNRFYTRRIGVLDERLADSPFSLAEARVLYELAHRDDATATRLGADLGLDRGYLSRILRRFGQRGLVARRVAPGDRRVVVLSLTPHGRAAFRRLDLATEREIGRLVARLSPAKRGRLIRALAEIETLLQ